MSQPNNHSHFSSYVLCGILSVFGIFFAWGFLSTPAFSKFSYVYSEQMAQVQSSTASSAPVIAPVPKIVPIHIAAPQAIKGIYMTSWIAGSLAARNKLINLIDTTEINTVVIDIKDYTGRISFMADDPYLKEIGSSERRIADIEELIDVLHKKHIYVIGRISSFQDAYLVKTHPEWAVRKSSDGEVWKDFKGISWLDASAQPVWDYLVAIAKESYRHGFDELNFDYIRFPSDGNMKDISYPFSGATKKSDAVKHFFAYISEQLRDPHDDIHATTPAISADLFGMTTTNKDDLGIGQVLENALIYFDYVDPMVYPSHYPPHFDGYDNPNHYPYEIVNFSMERAVERAKIASTTPEKLRPWLQDFDYGGNYDASAVRKQIQATYDAGLDSWILWSPSNNYTKEALEKES